MALLNSTYSALVSALGSSSSADDMLQYINYLALTNQEVDPGNTANVGIPGSTGYVLGIPGASISVEQIDVDLVPTASSTNKTCYSTSIGSSLSGSYNIGTAAGGASGSDLGGATNLHLTLENSGSGQRAQMFNINASTSNAGSGAVGLIENANFSTTLSSGSSTTTSRAFHADVNVNSGASVTNMIGFESSGNLAGTVTNYTAVKVAPSGAGTFSNSPKGIEVRLDDLSGITLGSGNALTISNGNIYSTGTIPVASGGGILQYNLLQNGVLISNNTTGSTQLCNDFGGSMEVAAGKSFVSGASPLPLSYLGLTGGTLLKIGAGGSMDHLVSTGAGLQINTGNSGTLTDLSCFVAGIARNLASTGTITNAYGFRILNSSGFKLSGAPVTNAWGISIEDTDADNFMARGLAVNVVSKKVSASTVGLELYDRFIKIDSSASDVSGIRASVGSATVPAYSFHANTSTGLYNDGSANRLNFALNGSEMLRLLKSGSNLQISMPAASGGDCRMYFGPSTTDDYPTIYTDTTSFYPATKNGSFNVQTGASLANRLVVANDGQVQFPSNVNSSAQTNKIAITSYDVGGADGRRSLALGTEEAVVVESVVSDATLAVTINGTTYKICLKS